MHVFPVEGRRHPRAGRVGGRTLPQVGETRVTILYKWDAIKKQCIQLARPDLEAR
jgi:hypothetical protein